MLLFHWKLPWLLSGRKEGTTSSQHGAYDLGHTHPTMANNNGTRAGNCMQIPTKFRLSSDWGLQPDPMKSELLVIAHQHGAVNTFSLLVHTARQANKVGGGRHPDLSGLSQNRRWGLSRNKVSLAEAGDGSPPFYFYNQFHQGFTIRHLADEGIQNEVDCASPRATHSIAFTDLPT